jgi:hypothetical protein
MRYPQFTVADLIWLTVLIAFVCMNWRPYWLPMTILIVAVWLVRAFLRNPRT